MFFLKCEVEFDSAHYLSSYEGKCSNIHGHRYRVVAEFAGEQLQAEGPQRGMLVDFSDAKKMLREFARQYDHKLIIEDNEDGRRVAEALAQLPNEFAVVMVPYRPTAEEMSRAFYLAFREKGYPIHSVEVFETPKNSCRYQEV